MSWGPLELELELELEPRSAAVDQQFEFAALRQGVGVVAAADALAVYEHVWHGPAARQLRQASLDRSTCPTAQQRQSSLMVMIVRHVRERWSLMATVHGNANNPNHIVGDGVG